MKLSYARIRDPNRDTLPSTYQEYAVLKDGEQIGTIKYAHGRWKSAGGPAWAAYIKNESGHDMVWYERDFGRLIASLRPQIEEIERRKAAHKEWVHSDPDKMYGIPLGEQVVYRDECMYYVVGFDREREEFILSESKDGPEEQRAEIGDLN